MHCDLPAKAAEDGMGLINWLGRCAAATTAELSDAALRARVLNVVPDFNGNRSPFADPGAGGVLSGLSLDSSISSLVDLYVASLCGLGYGLRQIISALQQAGISTEHIVVSGGAAQSEVVRQILSDATGHVVAIPESPEPVLLGAAMLGTVASGYYPTLKAAMGAMSRIATYYRPKRGHIEQFHQMKATAYSALQEVERLVRCRASGQLGQNA
jgi:D-ribulokinase